MTLLWPREISACWMHIWLNRRLGENSNGLPDTLYVNSHFVAAVSQWSNSQSVNLVQQLFCLVLLSNSQTGTCTCTEGRKNQPKWIAQLQMPATSPNLQCVKEHTFLPAAEQVYKLFFSSLSFIIIIGLIIQGERSVPLVSVEMSVVSHLTPTRWLGLEGWNLVGW